MAQNQAGLAKKVLLKLASTENYFLLILELLKLSPTEISSKVLILD